MTRKLVNAHTYIQQYIHSIQMQAAFMRLPASSAAEYILFTRLAVSPGRSVPDGVSALCRDKSRPVERFVFLRI